MTLDEDFVPAFEQRWRDVGHKSVGRDVFEALASFKECAYGAARDVICASKARDKRHSNEVLEITLLLRLLRLQDGIARGQDDSHF